MNDYENDRFEESLNEIKEQFREVLTSYKFLLSAVEGVDSWAVPDAIVDERRYSYVPIPITEFIKWISELDDYLRNDPDFRHNMKKYRPFSFLEIGCGIGRNLNIVSRQSVLPVAKAVGFDSVSAYIDIARQIHGLGENVFVGDCMDFDYSGFDVVYFYRPFSDEDAEKEFEKKLIFSMKKGAIVIGASTEYIDQSREMMPVGYSGSMFKKL